MFRHHRRNGEAWSLCREELRDKRTGKRTEGPLTRHSPARDPAAECNNDNFFTSVLTKARHLQSKPLWLVPDCATQTQRSHHAVGRQGAREPLSHTPVKDGGARKPELGGYATGPVAGKQPCFLPANKQRTGGRRGAGEHRSIFK